MLTFVHFSLWNHSIWSTDTETHTPAMSGNESDVKSDHIALAAGQREPGKGAELGNLCRFWSSCCKKGQQGPWTLQLRASFWTTSQSLRNYFCLQASFRLKNKCWDSLVLFPQISNYDLKNHKRWREMRMPRFLHKGKTSENTWCSYLVPARWLPSNDCECGCW